MADDVPNPNVPAGWYPDPTQPGSQRYWDGSEWTDQRAPLAQKPAKAGGWSFDTSPRLVVGIIGAVAAVVATFLPRAESAELLHIANNTLMANGDGILVVILALGAVAAAVRDSSKPDVSWPLIVLGLLTIGLAIVEGTGDRQEVINGLGQEVESKIGAAIWALGIAGALITLSGFLQSKESASAEQRS